MKRYISQLVMLIVASTLAIGTSVADGAARDNDQGAVRTLANKATTAVSKVVKRDRDDKDRQPVRNTVNKVSDAVKSVGDNEPIRNAVEKVASIAKRDGDREPLKKLAKALKEAVKRDGGRK